jgi:hypothetical protein
MLRSLAAALPALLALPTLALAQGAPKAYPANVSQVAIEKGKTVEVKGDLAKGAPVADLSFAAQSSVACFPATQNTKFRGPHVFYSTQLPPRSVIYITVIPDDPTQDVSLYGWISGTTSFYTPPTVPTVVSCEADHKWDRPKKGMTQDHTRTIRLNAINNPYNVFIGVTGPAGATGKYTLRIKTE